MEWKEGVGMTVIGHTREIGRIMVTNGTVETEETAMIRVNGTNHPTRSVVLPLLINHTIRVTWLRRLRLHLVLQVLGMVISLVDHLDLQDHSDLVLLFSEEAGKTLLQGSMGL